MTGGRTDIHFHLLPRVDDGPSSMSEAIALAALAVRDGSSTLVATPHVRGDFIVDVRELRDRVRELKEALARDAIPVSVLQGAELGHDMVGRLSQIELDAIAQGPRGKRWLLVETPFSGITPDFSLACDELRDRGFGIVLAHPERSRGVLSGYRDGLDRELSLGSALQVNAFSLAGRHGEDTRHVALRLVELHLVTAIASDAHGGWRVPALSPAYDSLVSAGVSHGVARRLVDSGPRRLMANGLAPVPAGLV
jgi:protein-tyrosine phosphatase